MAMVRHLSDGTNTWDVGGGTDVFSGDDIVHSKVKITLSGFTSGTYGSYTATIMAQSDIVKINFTNEQGTATEYTDLDTLYNAIMSNKYYEFELVNNSGNTMPNNDMLLFNTSGGNSILIQYNPITSFSGDDSPFGGLCLFKGYGTASINIVDVSAEHYNELKIIDPLYVKKINNVPCLTGVRKPKYFSLSYSNGAWKLSDEAGTVNYNDLRVGDTVHIVRSVQPLPNELNVLSAYMSSKTTPPKKYIKYVSVNIECRVVQDKTSLYGTIELQAPPVNYATSEGDAGSNDGAFVPSAITASSSESDIAAALRYLKNVVEENTSYSNHYYMLYGYDTNGAIANFNTHIHRIVYDDGSFAAIYYPAAGTIPDGIRPGFTGGAALTPPVGNWNPRITYDSMFFYSDNTQYTGALEYNGQGFYGTPSSGTGNTYTSNTNYIIAFGHFNNQYMAIKTS